MRHQMQEQGQRLLYMLERAIGRRDPVVGCSVVALIALGMCLVLFVMQGLALLLPGPARYYSHALLARVELLTLVISILYGGVAWFCWRHYGTASRQRWLPACLTGVLLATSSYIAVLYGLKDMPMSLMLLSAVALARTWFPAPVVLPGTVLAVLMLVASEVLTRIGLLPYAPLLAEPVLDGHAMAKWWLNWSEAIFNLVAIFFAGLMFFLFWLMRRYNEKLEQIARVDALTGLTNRATFMDLLDAYCRQRVTSEPACVLLCDIDRFRQINEACGRSAGDLVVRRIAAWLQQAVRGEGYVVARYGGGAFALLLPGFSLAEAHRLGDQLNAFLEGQPFGIEELRSRVTMSMGIVEDGEGDIADILRTAGGHLHYAKALGGNRLEGSVAAARRRPRAMA